MSQYFLVNRTQRTTKKWSGKTFPGAAFLLTEEFAKVLDVIELVELVTKKLSYCDIDYVQQEVYTYGFERIKEDGLDYTGAKQRAAEWLEEKIRPTGLFLPKPRCWKCKRTTEDLADVQSIRDSSRCWNCRCPKKEPEKKGKK